MGRLKGLRDLIFDAIEETTNLVERTHASVVERSVRRYAPIEPLTTPARAVQTVHTTAASLVYETIRTVNRGIHTAAATTTDVAEPLTEPLGAELELATPLRSDAVGSVSWLVDHAQSALNGFLGNHLSRRGNALDLGMSLRHHGRVLSLDRESLGRALPAATRKLCIFIHGLSCTEWSWTLGAHEYYGDPNVTFGTQLHEDLGYTPLYVRYNTGRHVSDSGRALVSLISELFAAYPEPVEDIALIGHSMGGLVARSAAHYAAHEGAPWISKLRHVVCLGSPHLGATLEQATNLLSNVLRAFDTAGTQVPRQILDARSSGIKDLRFGYILEDEWSGRDPECSDDSRQNVPFVEGVGYYCLAATFTADPRHPLGQIVGDLLVHLPSAVGYSKEPDRHIPFHSGRVFSGMHHFHLANHPDVYEVVRSCLESVVQLPKLPPRLVDDELRALT